MIILFHSLITFLLSPLLLSYKDVLEAHHMTAVQSTRDIKQKFV